MVPQHTLKSRSSEEAPTRPLVMRRTRPRTTSRRALLYWYGPRTALAWSTRRARRSDTRPRACYPAAPRRCPRRSGFLVQLTAAVPFAGGGRRRVFHAGRPAPFRRRLFSGIDGAGFFLRILRSSGSRVEHPYKRARRRVSVRGLYSAYERGAAGPPMARICGCSARTAGVCRCCRWLLAVLLAPEPARTAYMQSLRCVQRLPRAVGQNRSSAVSSLSTSHRLSGGRDHQRGTRKTLLALTPTAWAPARQTKAVHGSRQPRAAPPKPTPVARLAARQSSGLKQRGAPAELPLKLNFRTQLSPGSGAKSAPPPPPARNLNFRTCHAVAGPRARAPIVTAAAIAAIVEETHGKQGLSTGPSSRR